MLRIDEWSRPKDHVRKDSPRREVKYDNSPFVPGQVSNGGTRASRCLLSGSATGLACRLSELGSMRTDLGIVDARAVSMSCRSELVTLAGFECRI